MTANKHEIIKDGDKIKREVFIDVRSPLKNIKILTFTINNKQPQTTRQEVFETGLSEAACQVANHFIPRALLQRTGVLNALNSSLRRTGQNLSITQPKFISCISMPETITHLTVQEQLLIKGCIAGERASQAGLYHLYSYKMMGVCMWYARSREEAEEILQDGFLRVFTYINKFSGTGSFEGWMRKIMVNAALFKYRKKSHLRLVVEFNPDKHETPEDSSVLALLAAKELVMLVQTLSPAYRMVFNLYVLEGMKHREIAALLGISEGTSKSNLADARAVLQKALMVKNKQAAL